MQVEDGNHHLRQVDEVFEAHQERTKQILQGHHLHYKEGIQEFTILQGILRVPTSGQVQANLCQRERAQHPGGNRVSRLDHQRLRVRLTTSRPPEFH